VTPPDDSGTVYRIDEPDWTPYGLGRHVNHDPRSRRFAFNADAAPPLQSVYWPRAVPIFDQGQLGSCTGNAAAGWLATTNALRPGLTVVGPLPVTIDENLAVGLYASATRIDPYDGTSPPDDTGSDGLSVTKVLQEWGAVDSYAHAFDVGTVLAALMTGPVLVGTVWHQGMFDPDPFGTVTISGPVVGGHEYLLVGYDAARESVTFANSWGTGWADGGYGHMSLSTLSALLADDGDATIPHPAVTGPAPVPPAPGPGAGFPVDLDPDVAAHVVRAATRHHDEPSAWVNHHLRSYFR
jgi:hypothetical protein